MRLSKNNKLQVNSKATKNTVANRKINWPDLMFGPVNLWTLPPADFFYRKLNG